MRSGRKTILIVDDEPGTVDALTAVLEDSGYVVTSAPHGQAALDALRGQLPDFILLDVSMPVLDGPATLKAIRADPRLSRIAVVMMSGIPESMVKRRSRGYAAYLRKPFGIDELLAALQPAPQKKGKS